MSAKRFFIVISVLLLAVSLAAQNIDLIDKAKDAIWHNGDGTALTFGKDGAAAGSVMYRTDVVLEDGHSRDRVLSTHPQWKPQGRVQGLIRSITVPQDHPRLIIAGGFIRDAQKTDGARLTVVWVDPQPEVRTRTRILKDELRARIPGRDGEVLARNLVALDIRYNGRIDEAEYDLSAYAGKTGDILLTVEAGASADSDWAVWTEARIASGLETPEIPVPPGQAEPRLLKSFRAHGGRIYGASFSPDGRFIATVSADQTAKLWRVSEGEEAATMAGHSAHTFAAAFSADGRKLITASGDRTARIWNVPEGNLLHTLSGHAREVLAAAFRPGGSQVATGANDGKIKIWNAHDGNELKTFDFPAGAVNSLAFHPNNNWLAAAGNDGHVLILDADSGRQVRVFSGHRLAVYNVRFSRDGERLVTSGRDGTVRIWNTSGGQAREFGGGTAFDAAFDPSGRHIVAGYDGQGAIWNIDSGERLMTLPHPGGALRGVDWHPGANLIVLAGEDGQVRIWEIKID
ncbi:MAG: WD40 repeat domain-containing protein [Acidobacteriota bacterium]|nr:WD40 repeat domain-containing protein [Acidobacteriota bacterium]